MKITHLLTVAGCLLLSSNFSHASNLQKVDAAFVLSSYAKTKYPIVFAHGMVGFMILDSIVDNQPL
ncbi:MAG: hypothetical protein PHW70_10710 [Acinetobacter towneri]|nr:hypothetical protein [Acinetobacter towneri]